MDGITIVAGLSPDTASARRPTGLALQVALMAAHRDSLATPHGRPAPLEQRHIERIADGLASSPVRRASTARRHPPAAPGR